MPIFAARGVRETSVNTGELAGNAAPTETTLGIPFTVIVAFVTVAGAVEVLPAAAAAFALTSTAADAGPFLGAAFAAAFVTEAQAELTLELELAVQSVICWWNGSLLWNLLNETSWPADGGKGLLGSMTPSAEVALADAAGASGAVAAADDPSN